MRMCDIQRILSILLYLIVGGLMGSSVYLLSLQRSLPPVPTMLNPPAQGRLEVYDRHDRLLGIVGGTPALDPSQIARPFIETLLIVEDRTFFEHSGISGRALLRAAWANLTAGHITQGGSTITMQFARRLCFDGERSLRRKLLEMMMARRLEQIFSKEQILAAYCNQVYFGNGAYGVESAAQVYFGKPANALTWPESAVLVAVLKAPSVLNPHGDVEQFVARYRTVLHLLQQANKISEQDYTAWMSTVPGGNTVQANAQGYILDYVARQVETLAGRLPTEGVVYTTIDRDAQSAAVTAVMTTLTEMDRSLGFAPYDSASVTLRSRSPQAALVAVDVTTGGLLAMVGGRESRLAPFNRALARRQPGSSFKAFVYGAAMQAGKEPDDVYYDGPIAIPDPSGRLWQPDNFESRFYGYIILKAALMYSVNSVSVRLTQELTPATVAAFAHSCGIASPLRPMPSLALGTSEATPFEMATAFATFANGGLRRESSVIRRIVDGTGHVLYRHRPRPPMRALDRVSNFLILDGLKAVVDGGTARRLRTAGITFPDIAGKTGTSAGYRDAWFVGCTPTVATAIWIGLDDARPLTHGEIRLVGGNSAVPLFAEFVRRYSPALKGSFDTLDPEAVLWMDVDLHTGEPNFQATEQITVPYILKTRLAALR